MKNHPLYRLSWIQDGLAQEHPDWSDAELRERAILVRRELHRLNRASNRSDKRFRDILLLLGVEEIFLPRPTKNPSNLSL